MMMQPAQAQPMLDRYLNRRSRLYLLLRPPLPLIANPNEAFLPERSGVKLFVGGAGSNAPASFLNIDLFATSGVDIVADIHSLPFANDSVAAIECDAVLEHVQCPQDAVAECLRVLQPAGFIHIVVPFCHPFHEYPKDYQRWTIDGLKELLQQFEVIDAGIRTGPTATLLVVFLEYVKLLSPKPLRKAVYVFCGWLVWPVRYLDVWLNRKPDAQVLANHVYALARKPPD
jgi:SAM-dependent methyltransferase